ENDPDAHGSRFARKVANLLLDLIFEQLKIIRLQIRDKPVRAVGDSSVDHHKIDIDFEGILRAKCDSCQDQHRQQNKSVSSEGHKVRTRYHSTWKRSSGSWIATR